MGNARNPEFTAEQLAEVRRLQGLYPDRRGALLPVLYLAQDAFGPERLYSGAEFEAKQKELNRWRHEALEKVGSGLHSDIRPVF